MKKMEIKELGLKSVFKITLYIMVIPLILMALIGVIILIVGASIQNTEVSIIGGMYTAMPIFMLFIYAAINVLVALVYNVFSKRFGGLVVIYEEKELENENSWNVY
ncbi:hypothetical protein EJF36_07410 [Bacillus sp. HMF5848]|uniref:hypothetical protein n=1 Tax=Bacillus sp. HMF5848 TaxID=2495421 RepID=UPI000F7A21ED|nr:hypothetical protein [Bacillus sp. HMF5848]RSK26700.1 hypothetical protein EJF36_07410 [Bacillus sp. HMF5848]